MVFAHAFPFLGSLFRLVRSSYRMNLKSPIKCRHSSFLAFNWLRSNLKSESIEPAKIGPNRHLLCHHGSLQGIKIVMMTLAFRLAAKVLPNRKQNDQDKGRFLKFVFQFVFCLFDLSSKRLYVFVRFFRKLA